MNEEKTRTSNQSRSLRTVMLKLSLPNMRVHIRLECYFLECLVWIPMRRCSVLTASSPACIFPYFEIKWIYRMRNLSQSSFCGSTVEAEYCQSCILFLIYLLLYSLVFYCCPFRKGKTFTETIKVFLFKLERVSSGMRCSLTCLKTIAK